LSYWRDRSAYPPCVDVIGVIGGSFDHFGAPERAKLIEAQGQCDYLIVALSRAGEWSLKVRVAIVKQYCDAVIPCESAEMLMKSIGECIRIGE
jgi:hypothetical protein